MPEFMPIAFLHLKARPVQKVFRFLPDAINVK